MGITSWKALIHLVIVEIIINLIWNQVSKAFTIAYVREIGFLAVVIAGLFAVAWYLPKLAPIYTGRKTAITPKRTLNRPRLIHDGVLWEDGGNSAFGGIMVEGPLCPKDYTPLAKKRGGKVDTHLSNDTLISDSDYHSQLVCPECGGEYTLGPTSKIVQASTDEVRSRFEGVRRRQNN